MTSFFKLIAGLLVVAVVVTSSPPPTNYQHRPYSTINHYGKKPQEQQETVNASPQMNFPEDSESSMEQQEEEPNNKSKVIIKLASEIKAAAQTSTHKNPDGNDASHGCNCEKIDSCPIEMMDFSFAVSCSYGTVRCCRPQASIAVTPSVLVPVKRQPIKKLAMCKCKSRKECDWFFHNTAMESEPIDRKDEEQCPAGSVRCCETGNMGNPKEFNNGQQQQQHGSQHILGNNDFRPVQLPYLKMPNTERISETEPVPQTQELQEEEETAVPQKATEIIPPVIQPLPVPPVKPQENERPSQATMHIVQQIQKAQQQQQPIRTNVQSAAPSPNLPPQKTSGQPITPQIRPPTNTQQQPIQNVPVRQQGVSQFQQQSGVQIPPQGAPIHHVPQQPQHPIRIVPSPNLQQGHQPQLQQQQQPMKVFPGNGNQQLPFGFRPPPPAFNNQQQFAIPTNQQQPPARPVANQNFQQMPAQTPPVQPTPSSGGFFSSLMSMFSS